jgi:hypothetical protein
MKENLGSWIRTSEAAKVLACTPENLRVLSGQLRCKAQDGGEPRGRGVALLWFRPEVEAIACIRREAGISLSAAVKVFRMLCAAEKRALLARKFSSVLR